MVQEKCTRQLHTANIVQAQTASDISEADDAWSNIRKLTAFITACTDNMQMGQMSVVRDCVSVNSQFNDAMEKLLISNSIFVFA